MSNKTLLLMRHAKSDWSSPEDGDLNRPLAPRGEKAAPVMAGYLRKKGWTPGLVLCSPALRTRQTAELVAEALDSSTASVIEDALYNATPHQVLNAIVEAVGTSDVNTLLVVGHLPGIDGAALMLSGSGDKRKLDQIRTKFPTAAVAVIRAELDSWAALQPAVGELIGFLAPKEIAQR